LAATAGWRLDWSELRKVDNVAASRHNFHTARTAELVRVLGPVVARI
jgi:hypothetical protein